MNMKNQITKLVGLGLFSVLLFWACRANPVTGKKELSLMSPKKEAAIGKESDPQILAQFGVYDDAKLQAFITEKGNEMARISHMPDLQFQFKVVDSDVVNAFAVPGGYVYFTRGIMAYFNNEAQFAGVLGHEIGHVTHRHSAKSYTKKMVAQAGFLGGMILSSTFRGMAQQMSQGMQLMFLKFSRTHESQSDVLGVEYSSKIGYDSHEMAGFFATLARLSTDAKGNRIPEFMSTHPDPGKRHEKVNQLSDKWQSENTSEGLIVNRDSYLRMIDGLVYGPDPQQGFEENNMFYHPGMKFQFPVPAEWALQNSPSAIQMGPKDGSAIINFSVTADAEFTKVKEAFVTKHKFEVKSATEMTVNGLSAYKMISNLPQVDPQTKEQKNLSIQTVLIKYNGGMYIFHGIANPDVFSQKQSYFNQVMSGFNKLTDQSKIDRKPERIKIVTVSGMQSLEQLLRKEGIPEKRHKELAILNGMELKQAIAGGTLIKIIKRY